MRFVIQNYTLINKKVAVTPRLRALLILNNLVFFFLFYKNFYFFNWTNSPNVFSFNFFQILYKFFFFKQFLFFFKKMTLGLAGYYLNNFIKSVLFFFYKGLTLFFNTQFLPFTRAFVLRNTKVQRKLVLNGAFFAIKTLNVTITKTFFKSFFFMLFFFSTLLWYQHTNFIKFYLNFLLINPNYMLTPPFADFFLPVFNF